MANFSVKISKKALKNYKDLPSSVQRKLQLLIDSLEEHGPVQTAFRNYSKMGSYCNLGNNAHHCHLAPRYVAVWRCDEAGREVEVVYAGTREKAPY